MRLLISSVLLTVVGNAYAKCERVSIRCLRHELSYSTAVRQFLRCTWGERCQSSCEQAASQTNTDSEGAAYRHESMPAKKGQRDVPNSLPIRRGFIGLN